jgi:diguanylate cyclase (GGDEF)-like protein
LHYAAVPPGDYRFEVEALDPNRRNVSDVVSLAFTIRPPLWRTRWFYLIMAVLATLLSMLVWRWRKRLLLREQAALRELIAQRTSELEAEKSDLVAAREALLHQASHDALTGLWNRPAILEILEREMNRAHREGAQLAVVLADLDHFKQINDTYGHLAGDAILRAAARRMVENIRPYDFIGRYGGEEFLIILPGLSAEEPFSRLTQLHQAMSEKLFLYEGKSFTITSSFGVTSIDAAMMTIEDMVRCADEALYRAKDSGRDCIVFYSRTGQPNPLIETL